MAEWQGIYKRYLTDAEKSEVDRIVNDYKVKAYDGKVFTGQMTEADKVFLNTLFDEILHDFTSFKNIVYSRTDENRVILQPEKKWSPMFTGVSPIEVDVLLGDGMIMEKNCSQEQLDDHLVSRMSR